MIKALIKAWKHGIASNDKSSLDPTRGLDFEPNLDIEAEQGPDESGGPRKP